MEKEFVSEETKLVVHPINMRDWNSEHTATYIRTWPCSMSFNGGNERHCTLPGGP